MRVSSRFLTLFLTFIASTAVLRSAKAATAYVIVDAQTGYILEQQEPEKKLQVGSLTKIATASVVLDWSEQKSGDLVAELRANPESIAFHYEMAAQDDPRAKQATEKTFWDSSLVDEIRRSGFIEQLYKN